MYLCPSTGISLLDFIQPDLTFLIHGKVCLNIDGAGKCLKQNRHSNDGHCRRTWKVDGVKVSRSMRIIDLKSWIWIEDNQCVRGQKRTVTSEKFTFLVFLPFIFKPYERKREINNRMNKYLLIS